MALAMKKYACLIAFCMFLAIVMLFTESVIAPITVKSITFTLENCHADSGPKIVLLLFLFLATTAGQCLLATLAQILRQRLFANVAMDLTVRLIRRMLFSGPEFLQGHEPEKMVYRINRDVGAFLEYRLSLLLDAPMSVAGLLISGYIMFCGSFGFLQSLGFEAQKGNALLSTIILLMTPLHLCFLLCNRKFLRIEQCQAEASECENLIATETLRGVSDFRSSNSFLFVIQRLLDFCIPSRDAKNRLKALSIMFQNVRALVWGLTQVTILSVSAWLIYTGKDGFSFSDYMGFSLLCGMYNVSVVKVVEIILGWQKTLQPRDRIREILNLPAEYGPDHGIIPQKSHGALAFEDVSCVTSDGKRILEHVSFVAHPHEHIAIVGPSGSGKSTIFRIAMRQIAATAGEVCYAQTPVQEINFPYYAGQVAYVQQKPFIFQGTIRDNILLGRRSDISDAELFRLLDAVALTNDLRMKNPDIGEALNFQVGVGGQGLSGGQIAKIALARALIGKPSVLLLDEVTASLDELSQDKITRLIDEGLRHMTVVVVAHRLQTIRNMDRIVVLDSGRIVQTGRYEDLLSCSGLFATMIATATAETAERGPKGGYEAVLDS